MVYTSSCSRLQLTTAVVIGTECGSFFLILQCSGYHKRVSVCIHPLSKCIWYNLIEPILTMMVNQGCRRFSYILLLPVFAYLCIYLHSIVSFKKLERCPAKLFSIVEVNCLFIDIRSCLGSILKAFHNKISRSYL